MGSLKKLHPEVRLSIAGKEGESSVFGPGVAALCLGVRTKGSLFAAAKDMSMAYSKAWRIMKSTEEALGITLLNRDGAHGSTLTPEGIKILDAYIEINDKLQAEADELYAKLMK